MNVFFGRNMNKKGEMTTKEILEILLGAAAVFALIFLLASLLIGNFDKDEETAKSYLKTLNREIGVAEEGKIGDFDVLAIEGGKATFYIVYFGERIRVSVDNKNSFASVGNHKNHMCVCYSTADMVEYDCSVCDDFDYPMVSGVKGEEGWYGFISNYDWKIEKKGDVYEFSQ